VEVVVLTVEIADDGDWVLDVDGVGLGLWIGLWVLNMAVALSMRVMKSSREMRPSFLRCARTSLQSIAPPWNIWLLVSGC
jgi:hypothetical protein